MNAENKSRVSKKDQILTLYASGIREVADLALITHSRPTYVAGVLEGGKMLPGYFDLYTSSSKSMNVYSKYFAGKLGFKDEETARHSVELIDHYYRQFETGQDRAGQHHALLMALTMFDRARWTGKEKEAAIFGEWLAKHLEIGSPGSEASTTASAAQ
ncbi:MAG TPA: hypothetical protein VFA18_06390 [Gemmataceae bacterium]|nr:hypothetical protein [Gemmataceae bacterium]